MYKGDYDQEAIFLNKELDRKRIENEKCEAILYQADYEVLNSWNKDIRETRVVKFIHDNGTVYHGVYRGIDVDKNAPNSISNTLSTDEFFGSGDFWCAETDIPDDLEQTPCEIWLGNRDIDGNIDWNNSVYLNEKALKGWAANYNNNKDIEISDVMDDDDVIYFHIAKNGRGGYQNVEPSQLEKYLPHEEDNTDEEFEKAICNWAKDNLDISKLPHIEDATPAMQYLYNRVSSSENNMYYLDDVEDFNDELGMSQEEFEKQVDSDIEKFDLENVVVKDYDGALYACFGNLQCSFTQKDATANDKHIEHNANNEHYLTSPPPPLVDGVSIRINGLDDVTEREAKKYIDLVVQKVQESVRKNLSSISITKQEDGHIKLDYVLHHEPFERIRRITGYLVGSMDKWNNAKRAEEHERVKHIGKYKEDSGDPRVDEAIEKRFKQEQEYDKRFDELQEKEETYERCLEEKDFTHAYELHDSVSTENDALDFMKDVVRKHGTDSQTLFDAVNAVTNCKGETPNFTAKLLQDTLKTDEYKKAFEAEQGKTTEQENTK